MLPEYGKPKEKDALFAELLETSWTKLPELLKSLPLRKRWQFALRLSDKKFLSLNIPWKEILDHAATRQQQVSLRSIPPHILNNTEARVYLMTVPATGPSIFFSLLKEFGVYRLKDMAVESDYPDAIAFRSCLIALNSSLPHNRTYFSQISMTSIDKDTVTGGLDFIKNFHPA